MLCRITRCHVIARDDDYFFGVRAESRVHEVGLFARRMDGMSEDPPVLIQPARLKLSRFLAAGRMSRKTRR